MKVYLVEDPYKELGVEWGTPVKVCDALYKKKIREVHPDIVKGREEECIRLNEAIRMIRENDIPIRPRLKSASISTVFSAKSGVLHHRDLMSFEIW